MCQTVFGGVIGGLNKDPLRRAIARQLPQQLRFGGASKELPPRRWGKWHEVPKGVFCKR